MLNQGLSPQRVTITVDGVVAGTWYDPDHNPWKRLAESELELPTTLVREKRSIRVTFQTDGAAWTVGELRALCHVDQPLEAAQATVGEGVRFILISVFEGRTAVEGQAGGELLPGRELRVGAEPLDGGETEGDEDPVVDLPGGQGAVDAHQVGLLE